MKERFLGWKHSIQGKLLAYFTVLFLLVISSMIAFYRISINNIHETATESVKNTIRQVNIDTDRILTNALEQAEQVARDAEIQMTLRAPLPETEQELYKQRVRYNYILYDRNRLLEDINGIFVIGDNGAIYRSTRYGLRENAFRGRGWYKKVMKTGEVLWRPPHLGSDIVNNLDVSTISVVVPIKDRASTKSLGVVVAEIRTEQLKQMEESGLVFEGTTYILDGNNEIIYTSSDESLKETEAISKAVAESAIVSDSWTKDIKINGGKYLVSVAELSDSGWKIMGLISYEEMYTKAEVLRNSIFIVIGAFVLISILFAVIGANQISKPIREIRTTMKKVEKGDFAVHVDYMGKDEVGELARSFNHMVHKINQLIEQEQENQKKLRQAEFKALQSQINPHFLYNTLDSITWMARMNRLEKLEEMITALTNFLRIGLSRGRNEITLKEELKHVENYVVIQKIRYSRLLNYEVDVPEELKNYYVIKMILQPLVENALYHGIKEKGEPGVIRVTIRAAEEKLIISVSDNGMGMTPEKLQKIESMIEQGIDFDPNAYGVINVQKRIQTNYGEEYGLHFESEYNVGTRVYVTLPKKGDGEFAENYHS